MNYTLYDLALLWLVYAFLGWLVEAAYFAVTRRGFYDRGFLSAPLVASYGVTALLLLLVLPTLNDLPVLQFAFCTVIAMVVDTLAAALARLLTPGVQWERARKRAIGGGKRGLVASLAVGGAFYLSYLLVHPLVMAVELMIPTLVKQIVVWVCVGLLVVDFAVSVYALRTGAGASNTRRQREGRTKLAAWVSNFVWRRLRKAYPGIECQEDAGGDGTKVVFARGFCWDKLIWVFFITALGGDLIEMCWVRFVSHIWMSRSSVLYGPFSFVWGLGAVVLTVTLQPLAKKADRYVFLAGFVIGGVYEYMCSVFTELVFGTVFWDYSHMPLNIGGRTNVLFCFFWGVLALAWVKFFYPLLCKGIEAVPVVLGKVITWALVALMLCNGVLTGLAMLRHQARLVQPQPANQLEEFLDRQYGDAFMLRRWPNMRQVD